MQVIIRTLDRFLETLPADGKVIWPAAGGRSKMAWSNALAQYARTKDLGALPQGTLLRSDEHTLTIYDGYPKAKFHFLVLPRVPFTLLPRGAEDAKAKDAFEALRRGPSSVPLKDLSSLRSLLASPHASSVLAALRHAAQETVELIKEEQPYTKLTGQGEAGTTWPVHVGFHAVPSMEHVHLHIISSDLVSERLKNKKHYLSFHPSHGFWLPLEQIEEMARKGLRTLPHDDRYYEALLRAPLKSIYDDSVHSNMPKLKAHLEARFANLVRTDRALSAQDEQIDQRDLPNAAKTEQAGERSNARSSTSARRSASPLVH